MKINFERFVKWVKARFPDDYVIQGQEIRINSIFQADDSNHHLWCSTKGGKKKISSGVFHCFKTDRKGTLIKLVQLVDKCDRADAIATLQGNARISDLERKLEEFFAVQEAQPVIEPPKFTLPAGALLITDLPTSNWWRRKAEEYMATRKIPIDGLYVGTEEPYKFRLIIPYYDREGKLIYFNGRTMGKSKVKYRGPPKEIGVGKEDVVFMAGAWPEAGDQLYLCEGEFNAMSLNICELKAGACGGKNMGEKQSVMLAPYRITLCLDRDKAGKQGTTKMSSMISKLSVATGGREKLKYVLPPVGINDWNEMYLKFGPELVHHFIKKHQKPIDCNAPNGMTGDSLWLFEK